MSLGICWHTQPFFMGLFTASCWQWRMALHARNKYKTCALIGYIQEDNTNEAVVGRRWARCPTNWLFHLRTVLFEHHTSRINQHIKCESSHTSGGTLLLLHQMVSWMHVMVALLMTRRDPMVDQIDRHLQIFLSCCDRFSHLYYNQENLHLWANTSNFPYLLNLHVHIAKFGSIRWYWEGTRRRFRQIKKNKF